MPAPYGVTATGWNSKTLAEIVTELQDAFRLVFGAGINLEPQSVFSQLIGIIADREVDLWQIGADVYSSNNVRTATGQALEAVASLRGITRAPASNTLVNVTATGVNGTNIPAGTLFSIVDTGVQFESLALATISGGTASIDCQAVETGPSPAYAGTLTVIVNPISGLASVTNALDHTVLGTDSESDASLRQRIISAAADGNRFVDAIRNGVLAVSGVTDCYVFENSSDSTSADGIPPHAFETVVRGGADADIAEAILSYKAEGIQAYGTTTESVVDSQGFSVDIGLTRPDEVEVYVKVTVNVNPGLYPENGDDLVKQAIADYGDTYYHVGSNVHAGPLVAQAQSIAGVVNVSPLYIGLSDPPVASTSLSISLREYATLDTSRIEVIKVNLDEVDW